jgi:hypothetical protein
MRGAGTPWGTPTGRDEDPMGTPRGHDLGGPVGGAARLPTAATGQLFIVSSIEMAARQARGQFKGPNTP